MVKIDSVYFVWPYGGFTENRSNRFHCIVKCNSAFNIVNMLFLLVLLSGITFKTLDCIQHFELNNFYC